MPRLGYGRDLAAGDGTGSIRRSTCHDCHGRCDDSDAARVQLSREQRSLAQAKALPNSNDPMECAAEQLLLQRDDPWGPLHLGAGQGPGGPGPIRKGPECCGCNGSAALLRGFATHWRRVRYWREQAGGGSE